MSALRKCSDSIVRRLFTVKTYKFGNINVTKKISYGSSYNSHTQSTFPSGILLAFNFTSILVFLGLKDEEEESVLKKTLKRGQILIQKSNFDEADQMYHVALKMAQDYDDDLTINYIYSKLGEVSVNRGHHQRAIVLYSNLIERLLKQGIPENDLQVIHVSYKMAKCFIEMKEYEKAKVGLEYCNDNLKPQMKEAFEKNNTDLISMWFLVLDALAAFSGNRGDVENAFKYIKLLHINTSRYYGEEDENTIMVLNDLALIYLLKGDIKNAEDCAKKALKFGEKIPEMPYLSFIYVTLGRIALHRGLLTEAKKYCHNAATIATHRDYPDGFTKAEECLALVREAETKPAIA